MGNRLSFQLSRTLSLLLTCLCLLLLMSCGESQQSGTGPSTSTRTSVKQRLILPEVGVQDFTGLDPAQGTNENSLLAMNMIYSGLVRLNQDLTVIPDQATWTISTDRTVYTFHLKTGIMFSDGTPVTAQTYVYTLTRALLSTIQSEDPLLYLGAIVGASSLNAGKAKSLAGVRAIDATTLVITLTRPTDYFLQVLTNPIAFPLNKQLIERYGETGWSEHIAQNGAGTGPFMVQEWKHNTKMIFLPNPHYYGAHTHLNEVDIIFVPDAHTAFQAYQGGQYSLVWNILPSDLPVARGLSGYTSQSLLQTDTLFFNTQISPFNEPAVRQAFALAIDKATLVHSVLDDSVIAAPTIIPAGIPGYQPELNTLSFDHNGALNALKSVYPDPSQIPPITFTYPNSLLSPAVAGALRQMWQAALGITVTLIPVEINAYSIELSSQQVQFGFTQWSADFADPFDVLEQYLLSTSATNYGRWHNTQFNDLIAQAEQATGSARLNLYAQAEQIAITDVGWLPLDHQETFAVLPATVHGVSLNHMGLYFGDWSEVSLSPR